ncbi:hypothetical protein AMAG_00127 [Allomyces macrogynus ATCC 38327]|uniref:DDE Tnp4 domain-containing protein n=1 Tax=Allomyces macrogynus (strain ATCC 38327) TaxID=578462 RepID=A0A0L0RVL2_ALLM3|nr:hypothetical protein AMAG_00127 [Allomyces macrogynus ATCC 38327]|eukprot:KNE54125.1 hypothetical protein AMAG_00127 [Allomyces macrogynus ATCC 38327]
MLLTLMRLKLGLELRDLTFRFGISPATVSHVFRTWVKFLAKQLSVIDRWLSRSAIEGAMPAGFRELYPSTRIIIDVTKLKIQKLLSLTLQVTTYPCYKSSNTAKFLIAIVPNGMITYVSKGYPGCISDYQIMALCKDLVEKLDSGDMVMADCGFKVKEILHLVGTQLNVPPGTKKDAQMSWQSHRFAFM